MTQGVRALSPGVTFVCHLTLMTSDNASGGQCCIQLTQFTRPRPQAPGCPVLGRSGRGRLILSAPPYSGYLAQICVKCKLQQQSTKFAANRLLSII